MILNKSMSPQADWSDIKRMLIQVDKFIENLANFEFYNFP